MKERDASPFLLSSLLKATPLGPSLVRRCLASFALSGGAHGFPKVPDPAVALRRPVQDTVPTGAPATHASPSPSPSPTLLHTLRQRGGGVILEVAALLSKAGSNLALERAL